MLKSALRHHFENKMNVQKERKRRYYSRISIQIDKGVFDMKISYKGIPVSLYLKHEPNDFGPYCQPSVGACSTVTANCSKCNSL